MTSTNNTWDAGQDDAKSDRRDGMSLAEMKQRLQDSTTGEEWAAGYAHEVSYWEAMAHCNPYR